VSLLYILAEKNLPNLIRIHPSRLLCFKPDADRYGPPIFAALATGGKEAVQTFLDIQAENQPPTSPLRGWCEQGYQDGTKRISLGRNFTFSRLRSSGLFFSELACEDATLFAFTFGLVTQFDGHMRWHEDWEPLPWAAETGNELVVRLLLERGADLDLRDREGQAPLSLAVEKGHKTVVKLLLDHGAKTESKDRSGRTPLSRASKDGQEGLIRLLLDHGAHLDSKDYDGRTALSHSSEMGFEVVARLLLEHGADPGLMDGSRRAPLSYASKGGSEALVKLLLEQGVDREATDSFGRTPLYWAADWGNREIVRLLETYYPLLEKFMPLCPTN